MSPGPSEPVLDHLALASRRAWDHLERYARQFGARWLGGPSDEQNPAFYFCQVAFANGTKLEFVEPNGTPGSDFIDRFLHRNGPGPHHLTFKVPDIGASMATAESGGYRIVNADLSSPDWKEAFLHPKESHGIVIQLAQQGEGPGWEDPPPLPPSEQPSPATIDRITHAVADLDRATALFVDVLAMTEGARQDGPMGPSVELHSGPWLLRLLQPDGGGPGHWLGDRPGRLLQVEMTVGDIAPISGLVRRDGFWELPPERNLGTRLLVRTRDDG